MAAMPAGAVIGTLALTRLVSPPDRMKPLVEMALLPCVPLIFLRLSPAAVGGTQPVGTDRCRHGGQCGRRCQGGRAGICPGRAARHAVRGARHRRVGSTASRRAGGGGTGRAVRDGGCHRPGREPRPR